MEREEYVRKAKALGHTDDMITETLTEASEWESKVGLPYDFEMQLIDLPISDPNPIIKKAAR